MLKRIMGWKEDSALPLYLARSSTNDVITQLGIVGWQI